MTQRGMRMSNRKAIPPHHRFAELLLKEKPHTARREARNTRKKLVAKVFRRESVYNRAEKPSETFCGKESWRRGRRRGAASRDGTYVTKRSGVDTERASDDFL